jgi:hypothetical protein
LSASRHSYLQTDPDFRREGKSHTNGPESSAKAFCPRKIIDKIATAIIVDFILENTLLPPFVLSLMKTTVLTDVL